MHILKQDNDTLIAAETRQDGSIRVNFYQLRDYMELTSLEFESLIELRALERRQEEPMWQRLMRVRREAGAPISHAEAEQLLHDAGIDCQMPATDALQSKRADSVLHRFVRTVAEGGKPMSVVEGARILHDMSLPLGRPSERSPRHGA